MVWYRQDGDSTLSSCARLALAGLALWGLAGCARVRAITASAPAGSARRADAPAPVAVAMQMSEQAPAGAPAANAPLLDYSGPKEFLHERCDQLAQHFPGVEELRLKTDNTIESRQWTLVAEGSAPRWALAIPKNGPRDGWMPKPNIAKLQFVPPVGPQLARVNDQFLAYAWAEGDSYEDLQKMGSLTTAFGDAQGSFQWQGRHYAYALSPKLPCFPWLVNTPPPNRVAH